MRRYPSSNCITLVKVCHCQVGERGPFVVPYFDVTIELSQNQGVCYALDPLSSPIYGTAAVTCEGVVLGKSSKSKFNPSRVTDNGRLLLTFSIQMVSSFGFHAPNSMGRFYELERSRKVVHIFRQ
jgi:hypothetical protein